MNSTSGSLRKREEARQSARNAAKACRGFEAHGALETGMDAGCLLQAEYGLYATRLLSDSRPAWHQSSHSSRCLALWALAGLTCIVYTACTCKPTSQGINALPLYPTLLHSSRARPSECHAHHFSLPEQMRNLQVRNNPDHSQASVSSTFNHVGSREPPQATQPAPAPHLTTRIPHS